MRDAPTLAELESLLGVTLKRYYPGDSTSHPVIELARIIDNISDSVGDGDERSIQIACLLISVDPRLPFGKGLKSRLARGLRRQSGQLNEVDRRRIVECTSRLLSLEYCPGEAEEYCRLVKSLGAAETRAVLGTARPQSRKSQKLIANLEQGIA